MAKKLIIVGLGDSTTAGTPGFMSPVEEPPEGVGNPESQYCYWMMEAHPEWTVLNKGVNGQRTDEIMSRFDKDVVAEKPSVVIVLAGVNDIYQGRAANSVERNLESMYVMAEGRGIVPVAATVLPYNTAREKERASIREVNAWIETASRAPGRLFCDTNLAVRDKDAPDFLSSSRDGLHPDVNGYRAMGDALSAALKKAGY
ncbi:MAG TPA: GDSL-type esterase/lipase family protein [Nitrososphaerales archaeon]|nr:GDSL-type esterase/lipase family protein [Nitrososphaerales archaeon]